MGVEAVAALVVDSAVDALALCVPSFVCSVMVGMDQKDSYAVTEVDDVAVYAESAVQLSTVGQLLSSARCS